MLVIFSACEETDLENQPELSGKPKLVLTGFISPEEKGVKIKVTRSRLMFGPDSANAPNDVPDATVLLSDGSATYELPNTYSDNIYADPTIVIIPGRTYTLKVSTPAGLSAEATCTVPAKINTSITARFDSSTFQPESDLPDYVVETTWKDIPGEGDYYRTSVLVKFKDQDADTAYYPQPMADDGLNRDFQADGRAFRTSTTSIMLFRQLFNQHILPGFAVYLFTTDRHYFEYHRSLYRFQNANSFEDPIRIYSNIKGGLGIFAAYRSHKMNLKL